MVLQFSNANNFVMFQHTVDLSILKRERECTVNVFQNSKIRSKVLLRSGSIFSRRSTLQPFHDRFMPFLAVLRPSSTKRVMERPGTVVTLNA
jgi:hypothetical protein